MKRSTTQGARSFRVSQLAVVLGGFIVVAAVTLIAIGGLSPNVNRAPSLNSPIVPTSAPPTLTHAAMVATAEQRQATTDAFTQHRQQERITAMAATHIPLSVILTHLPPTEPPRLAVFPTVPSAASVDTGAIVQISPPFSSMQFHVENDWYRDSKDGKRRLIVFAGGIPAPDGQLTDQGVVVVQLLEIQIRNGQPIASSIELMSYPTPMQGGSIHVTNAQGNRIALLSSKDHVFYFDLASRHYVNGMSSVDSALLLPLNVPPSTPVPGTPSPLNLDPIPASTPAGNGAIANLPPLYSQYQHLIENAWYFDVDPGKKRIVVYAGSVSMPNGDYVEQGIVTVWSIQLDAVNHTAVLSGPDMYLTPVEAGSVHITGEQGSRLILQSTKGVTFYFDLPTRQYVGSMSEVVNAATP